MENTQLIELRQKNDLSQHQLAKLLGLTRSQLSRYELGTRIPDYDTQVRIAEFFNVSIEELFIDQGEGTCEGEQAENGISNESHKPDPTVRPISNGTERVKRELDLIHQQWLPYYGQEYMEQVVKHVQKNPHLVKYWLQSNPEKLQHDFDLVMSDQEVCYWSFYDGGYAIRRPGQEIVTQSNTAPEQGRHMGAWKLDLALCLTNGHTDLKRIFFQEGEEASV